MHQCFGLVVKHAAVTGHRNNELCKFYRWRMGAGKVDIMSTDGKIAAHQTELRDGRWVCRDCKRGSVSNKLTDRELRHHATLSVATVYTRYDLQSSRFTENMFTTAQLDSVFDNLKAVHVYLVITEQNTIVNWFKITKSKKRIFMFVSLQKSHKVRNTYRLHFQRKAILINYIQFLKVKIEPERRLAYVRLNHGQAVISRCQVRQESVRLKQKSENFNIRILFCFIESQCPDEGNLQQW